MFKSIISVTIVALCLVVFGHGSTYSIEEGVVEPIPAGIPDIEKNLNPDLRIEKMQLPFIKNAGQYDNDVGFYARTFAATAFITKSGEIIYSLSDSDPESRKCWAVKESLAGSKLIAPTGEQQLPAIINVFRGKDQSRWAGNVSAYSRIGFNEVYDGIVMRLTASYNNIEKFFFIKPGANPDNIKIRLDGIESIKTNNKGELEISTESGILAFTRPIAYYETETERQFVDVEYKVNKDSYGFTVGDYDKTKTLIIDPLLASTYLGGSNNEGNVLGGSMVMDDDGNVYVAARTRSIDFPYTVGAYSDENNGNYDVFIAKLTGDLTTLLASTYLGGSGYEGERGSPDILLDDSGYVYITGITNSLDFPTVTGGHSDENAGNFDIFISKLSNDLDSLLASTYFGSSGFDQVNSMAIDGSGNIFIAGYTRSSSFPITTGAFQDIYYGTGSMQWGGEVFISKFSHDLSTLLASTYLGGSDWDEGGYLAVDDADNIYIVGSTRSGTTGSSHDFPTTPGAFSPGYNGDYIYGGDAFVSKMSNDLTTLIASTYLGGNSNDWGYNIALSEDGYVYVTGHTPSSDFPTVTGSYDEDYNSSYGSDVGNDMYVSKFTSDLSTLVASTFLGTYLHDISLEIALDSGGNVYLGGHTNTTGFPTTPGCYDDSFNGGSFDFGGDIIFACFDPDLTDLKACSYLGGYGQEDVLSIKIDADNNLCMFGFTNSVNFPVDSDAYQNDYHGGSVDEWGGDLFVTVIPAGYFSDLDSDMIPDLNDNCPNTPNFNQEDTDLDSIGDSCDNCIHDYNPDQTDTDGDNIGDACDWTCGDTNGDNNINIIDITYLIEYLYMSGPPPDPMEAANVNNDGAVNILDVSYLISYLYMQGPQLDCPPDRPT